MMAIVSEGRCNLICDIAFLCACNVLGNVLTRRLKVRLRKVGVVNATRYVMHNMHVLGIHMCSADTLECRPL
jgi:hypothetical protein